MADFSAASARDGLKKNKKNAFEPSLWAGKRGRDSIRNQNPPITRPAFAPAVVRLQKEFLKSPRRMTSRPGSGLPWEVLTAAHSCVNSCPREFRILRVMEDSSCPTVTLMSLKCRQFYAKEKKKLFHSLDTQMWSCFRLCLFVPTKANCADIFLIYWEVKRAFAAESSLSDRAGTHFSRIR